MSILMTANELARVVSAEVRGDGRVGFSSVSTDSRSLSQGALFVALTGQRFDGHEYVAQARANGAVAALVERAMPSELAEGGVVQLIVADSKRAFGSAAAAWRARFSPPVIAVTGSNGKTTVTQMIGAILAAEHGEKGRLATRGNLNNEIGVPLMLWQLSKQHRAAVFELGMNHRGEIATLAHWVRPTVALVTNAQREHQEFLHSVEATAQENGEAIAALSDDGIAVFPADDPCASIWRQLTGTRRVIDFALDASAVVTATWRGETQAVQMSMATPQGVIDVRVAAAGAHTVRNALAAAAAALAAGIGAKAIVDGLAAWRPGAGRGARVRIDAAIRGNLSQAVDDAWLIDDSYNANPDSVRAAVDLLAQSPAPRVLVLGEMGEVGARGAEFHREIGEYARERGIEALFAIGPLMRDAVIAFGSEAKHFDGIDVLIEALRASLHSGTTVLVKGSRFMRMERVAQALAVSTEVAH